MLACVVNGGDLLSSSAAVGCSLCDVKDPSLVAAESNICPSEGSSCVT